MHSCSVYQGIHVYARFHNPSYNGYRETHFSILIDIMKHEMYIKDTGSMCMLVEYVKDNHYARFHNPSYHGYRETHFSISLNKILTKSMKHEM